MARSGDGTALVVGASRGLGLGLAEEWLRRGWSVIGTVRGPSRTGLHELAERFGERLTIEQLETTDPHSIEALAGRLSGRELDVLFVSAAIARGPGDRIDQISTDDFVQMMLTNVLAPMRVVEKLGPLVRPEGTIAVMSSRLGSVSLNESGTWEVYRASKAALNQLMRSYAARHADDPRSLVVVDPGWVRTDMGGSRAALGIGDSIPGIVTALANNRGKRGLKFLSYKGETVPW